MEHTKDEWKVVFTADKARGVRNSNGFICFLPKPFHYAGQDARYQNELEETEARAHLIATAPETKKQHDALLGALRNIVSEAQPISETCRGLRGRYETVAYRVMPCFIEDARQAIPQAEES